MCDEDTTCGPCAAAAGKAADPETGLADGLTCEQQNSMAEVLPGLIPPAGTCPVTPERQAAEERQHELLDPAMERAGLKALAARIEEAYTPAPAVKAAPLQRHPADVPTVRVKSDCSVVKRWRDGSTETTSGDGRSCVKSGPRFRAGVIEKSMSTADRALVAGREAAGLRTRVGLVPVEDALRVVLTKAERQERRHRAHLATIAREERQIKADQQRHEDNARLRRLDREVQAMEAADRDARISGHSR
jgi:hypothetical protein